jgi:hypothetical protein
MRQEHRFLAVDCRVAALGSAPTRSMRAGPPPSVAVRSTEHFVGAVAVKAAVTTGVRAGKAVCARIGDRELRHQVRGARPAT